jgi:cytidyltransferase-like protein
MNKKKVFVSGCFDMMHSGHIRFLEEASSYGDVYVGIGSDSTIKQLKGKHPITTQEERKYMLEGLRFVYSCVINTGSGLMDFIEELKSIKPDYFVVNEDGNTAAKVKICNELGIEYIVLKRKPYDNLPIRSTTTLRQKCTIPYRIDLAGGWLDQPFVSKLCSGAVIGISIEPTIEFNERSGMATSTRNKAIELWKTKLPDGDFETNSKILFSYENPPGTLNFSGAQDSINLVFSGLTCSDYCGEYWPYKIINCNDEEMLSWLENCLHLIPLEPRKSDFDAFKNKNVTEDNVKRLSTATYLCWQAILNRDIVTFGKQMRASFESQINMFPSMLPPEVEDVLIQYHSKSLGWKISGAGGGGYLILVSDKPIDNSLKIKIRRNNSL